MIRKSLVRTVAAAAAIALGVSACAGANSNGSSNNSGGTSSVLTIQGDAGDPTLTENFNPFSSTQLEGTRLIYEPLEIPSSVNGSYTPFLATGYTVGQPDDDQVHDAHGREVERRQAFQRCRRRVHVQPAEEVPRTRHHRGVGAAEQGDQLGQQRDDDAQGAERAVRRHPRPGADRAAAPVAVGVGPDQVHQHQTGRHRAVQPGHLRADPIHVEEEHVVLAGRQDRADRGEDSRRQSSNQSTNQLDVTSGKFDWSYNYLPDVQKTYRARGIRTTPTGSRRAARSACS